MISDAFLSQMTALIGTDECQQLMAALQTAPTVAVRPNRAKGFTMAGEAERVAWSSYGYYLKERAAFTFDPLFHAGAYYVQEPSSMFLEQAYKTIATYDKRFATDNGDGIVALDLCAAPGGKSTLLRSLLPEGALLICNEPMVPRVAPLCQNISRWGHPDVVVTSAYAKGLANISGVAYDLVVVDAPCSGEGMFRKDPQAVAQWTTGLVTQCAATQREILADIWPAVRPDGWVIYSTCTYNTTEDEGTVAYACRELGAEVVGIDVNPDWGVIGNLTEETSSPVYHFMPHRARGEGFFLALLHKPASASAPRSVKNMKPRKWETPTAGDAAAWIMGGREGEWDFTFDGETLSAIRRQYVPIRDALVASVRTAMAGIPFATAKGAMGRKPKWQPTTQLALSLALNAKAFTPVELTRNEALAYLRREAVTMPATTARGYVLLTYEGAPLGFVNNIGARANNLYPQAWRILSTHIPESAERLVSHEN